MVKRCLMDSPLWAQLLLCAPTLLVLWPQWTVVLWICHLLSPWGLCSCCGLCLGSSPHWLVPEVLSLCPAVLNFSPSPLWGLYAPCLPAQKKGTLSLLCGMMVISGYNWLVCFTREPKWLFGLVGLGWLLFLCQLARRFLLPLPPGEVLNIKNSLTYVRGNSFSMTKLSVK